ncbi:alpha/beta hydrolase [Candidatus Poribacteria bacterium]|nr:alpha/beta hydrolase [Candidatus Poribacteria bacterium]
MKRNIIVILFFIFFISSCSYVPMVTREIKQQIESAEIPYDVRVLISPEAITLGSNFNIKAISTSNFSSLLPSFEIASDKVFIPGGKVALEFPIPEELIKAVYNGDKNQIILCYYNYSTGSWKKLDSKFDSTGKILQTTIQSLKKENLDSTLSKILISVSFPAKEGYISNLYQKNKLVGSGTGNLDDFYNENTSGKNCLIIHGVTSSPENMVNLYKTIKKLNYYKNIIFYQYASGDHIKNNAEWLATVIKTSPDIKLDIIAHSMGGLVARSFIEEFGMDKNVDKLIMIGTPNNGGNFTELAPVLFPKTVNALTETFPGVQDLITGSKFFNINKEYNKNNIKTKYYIIAGDIGGDRLVKSDLCVSVISAAFLNVETEMALEKSLIQGREIATIPSWKYYRKSVEDSSLNMLYEHSNLHVCSIDNGVGEQIAEWLKE